MVFASETINLVIFIIYCDFYSLILEMVFILKSLAITYVGVPAINEHFRFLSDNIVIWSCCLRTSVVFHGCVVYFCYLRFIVYPVYFYCDNFAGVELMYVMGENKMFRWVPDVELLVVLLGWYDFEIPKSVIVHRVLNAEWVFLLLTFSLV